MVGYKTLVRLAAAVGFALAVNPAQAQDSFTKVADQVNQKLVKLYGSGGFQRINSYGTGILVSPDGYILTMASQMLETTDLIVHLSDGRRVKATTVVVEPELDAALLKIKADAKAGETPPTDLPYFDVAAAAKRPTAQPGDWVLAVSNTFRIADRDEPLSVQRGVIASHTKLIGRRGVSEAPYQGEVYYVDTIANNPGAGGGALTTRKGELLGIIGKELRNSLSDTWVNYAVPINAKLEIKDGEVARTISMPEFVALGMKGEYKPTKKREEKAKQLVYHGIIFVPNVLQRTPPYVEGVVPDSPAAKAGLRPDDLVSFVDGEPVVSINEFNKMVGRIGPNQQVRLEVRRGDKLQTIELTLAPPLRKPEPKK
jgi:serine protease Do